MRVTLPTRLSSDTAPGSALRVLHVVECFAGGVRTALIQYIRSTPDIEHFILAGYRDSAPPPDTRGFVLIDMVHGHVQRVGQIATLEHQLRPDVVHAHSSFAGIYARVASAEFPLVYTPHCYAFERQDISRVERRAMRTAERLLSRRTTLVGGCSEREAKLAQDLHCPSLMIPNVGRFEGTEPPRSSQSKKPHTPRVCFNGRLCPQKDPEFALQVVKALRKHVAGDLEVVWIGSGSDDMEQRFADGGVHVTGWLDRDQVRTELEACDVYLHCARWEGFPMAVLEARQLGLPIIARRIPSLTGMPNRYLVDDPDQMAIATRDLLSSPERMDQCWNQWRVSLGGNSREQQGAMLRLCYARAIKSKQRHHLKIGTAS